MTAHPMERPRILVAGVGNIFLGDDAFGVEVVRRLSHRSVPGEVRVVDFGIRGLDLAYGLLDGYEAVILVDASPRGGVPGTLYVLEPEIDQLPSPPDAPAVEMHNMDLTKVLRLALALGGPIPRLVLVGCEPQFHVPAEEMSDGLSEPVRAVLDETVALVESLIARLLRDGAKAEMTATHPLANLHGCRGDAAGTHGCPAGVSEPTTPSEEDRTCHP
jgi:hydrogenase maturation protease